MDLSGAGVCRSEAEECGASSEGRAVLDEISAIHLGSLVRVCHKKEEQLTTAGQGKAELTTIGQGKAELTTTGQGKAELTTTGQGPCAGRLLAADCIRNASGATPALIGQGRNLADAIHGAVNLVRRVVVVG
jgi:hypothetical protein